MLSKLGRLVPDQVKGWIDFYRFPARRIGYGGPFNGQIGRQELFRAVISAVQPSQIFETGTHLGTTTEFMAQFGLPVLSVESHPRNFGFASARLRRVKNVELAHGDSRDFLRDKLAGDAGRPGDVVLAYLDAHRSEDLPLAEELDIIFTERPLAVAMIDDFKVPDDAGYGHDDYGPGKTLSLQYVEPVIRKFGLAAYLPRKASAEETGKRRGCLVLASRSAHDLVLGNLSLLRRAEDAVIRTKWLT